MNVSRYEIRCVCCCMSSSVYEIKTGYDDEINIEDVRIEQRTPRRPGKAIKGLGLGLLSYS